MAKQATLSEQNTEFRVNAQAKEKLLAEAEALLPISDPRAARRVPRHSATLVGHRTVPREAMRPLESRLRAVDNAIKAAEDERWQRSNPEAKARAADTAAKLEAQIAALEARAEPGASGVRRASRLPIANGSPRPSAASEAAAGC